MSDLQAIFAWLETQRPILGDAAVDNLITKARESGAAQNGASPVDYTGERSDDARSGTAQMITCMYVSLSGTDKDKLPRLIAASTPHIREPIQQFGGENRGVLGNAYLFAFREDPARAAQAALVIRERLLGCAEEAERDGLGRLSFRIALTYGLLPATQDSAGRTAARPKDLLELVTLLAGRAAAGGILLSEQMRSFVAHEFILQPGPVIEYKNRRVNTLQLLGSQNLVMPGPSIASLRKVFIGRQRELNEILGYIEQLGAGRGSVVLVAGETGVGKTRLIEEARSSAPIFKWLGARCHASAVTISYAAWNDLLLLLIGADILTPATALDERLRSWLDEAELADHYEAFATQLGLREPENTSAARFLAALVAAWTGVLHWLARSRPAVIVLDEAHLMDSRSMCLFERLVEDAPALPILWVLVVQPGYAQAMRELVTRVESRLGEGYGYMGLEPLPEDEQRLLVRGALGLRKPQPAFEDHFLQITGGNPLMILHSLRWLIEKRSITRDGRGDWQIVVAGLSERQPDSLYAVVSMRVQGLLPEARELLQIAALAGNTLVPHVIEDASGARRAQLVKHLRALDFLDETQHFHNPCVGQVIAQEVADDERAAYYAQIAALLDVRLEVGGPWLALAAHIIGQSGQAQKAIRLYTEAKAWLYQCGALTEVSSTLEAMRGLLDKDQNKAQYAALLVEQEQVLSELYVDSRRCIALLAEAYDLWMLVENYTEAARTMLRAAVYHTNTEREFGCYQDAQMLLERVSSISSNGSTTAVLLPEVYMYQALYALRHGRSDAKALFEKTTQLAYKLEDKQTLAKLHYESGIIRRERRQLAEALKDFKSATSYFRELGDAMLDDRVLCGHFLADVYLQLGRPADAEPLAYEAAEKSRRASDYARVDPYITLAQCYASQNRLKDALDTIADAPIEIAELNAIPLEFWRGRFQFEHDPYDGLARMRESVPRDRIDYLLTYIDFLLEESRFAADARAELAQLSRAGDLKDLSASSFPLEGFYKRLQGRLALAEGHHDRALIHLETARSYFDKESFIALAISTQRLIAQVMLTRCGPGDRERAAGVLNDCLNRYRAGKLSLVAELSRIQALLRRIEG